MTLDDRSIWASVAESLTTTVLPCVDDAHARATVVQLIGLARYVLDRGADPSDARRASLAAAMGLDPAGADEAAVMAAATDVLARSVGSADAALLARRDVVRRLLVDALDEDLAAEAGLIEAFRGRVPGE